MVPSAPSQKFWVAVLTHRHNSRLTTNGLHCTCFWSDPPSALGSKWQLILSSLPRREDGTDGGYA